jgi:acetyl-CoA synthetase
MDHWTPSRKIIENSNIHTFMRDQNIQSYDKLWRWSVQNKNIFWEKTVDKLGIQFDKKHSSIVDTSKGIANAEWLYGAKFNITDSCFQNSQDSIAVILKDKEGELKKISQKELELQVNSVSNGLIEKGLTPGDTIAIYMPMTLEAVAIYLGAIKAGMSVATIADSFSVDEISVRFDITKPKLVFTQDGFKRGDRVHLLYKKCKESGAKKCVVINYLEQDIPLGDHTVLYKDFLSSNTDFTSVKVNPSETSTILFSSGTTSEPKAIPWDHTTPIKSASDGFYHHDIQPNNIICWPTNLGWMMGPWLVFAALINKATIALYYGGPLEEEFGQFIEEAEVTMLGIVPSIVKSWKLSRTMEKYNWNSIRCFSSTGEVSNSEEMKYLMQLGNKKPIIEYCGGTEIGGGYIASTLVQKNIPSQFSSQTLGGEFVLLDHNGEENIIGEVFLIPPIMGLSNRLLNKNHHDVYYKGIPKFKGKTIRKHGDELYRLKNNYFKANGRIDDTMNLGGIKIGAVQIEAVVNSLEFIKESAAISVTPKNGGPSELIIYFVELSTIPETEALKKVQNCIKSKLNPLFKVVDLVKIDNLPRTASKKVKRKELRKLYKNL